MHTLFWNLIGLWVIMDFYILIFYKSRKNKLAIERKSKYVMLVLISAGMLSGPFLVEGAKEAFQEPFWLLRQIGLLIILAGIIVRIIAIRQLGENFSKDVDVHQDKSLYQRGLYRFVRHPSYLGELMIFLGVAIVYDHWLASLLAFILPTLAFVYRIQVEEKMLLSFFPVEYADYMKKTKKLIPFIY